MICSSVCLLRFIVWSFLKARLQFTLDQFNGATSPLLQKVGSPVPESHKNWGPCFTSPKNAAILLFLDLFRLLWR